MLTLSRRSAVLAGLGIAAAAPTAALAETVTRLGYRDDGEAFEGLVTVEGKTYLYQAGVMYKGGAIEYRGQRWFSPEDGHMAAGEDVEWPDGTTHHYGPDGVLRDGQPVDDDWYTVRLKGTDLALDVSRGVSDNGTAAQAYTANGSAAQAWYLESREDGTTRIVSGLGRALDLAGGSKEDGAKVQIWSIDEDSANQAWTVVPAGGCYRLRSEASGNLLTVAADKGGTPATSSLEDSGGFQDWLLEAREAPAAADGWYCLVGQDGLALDVTGGAIKNGANIQAYAENSSDAQRFKLAGASLETFVGKALDVLNASAAAGTNVQQYEANGSAAQKWSLAPDKWGYTVTSALGALVLTRGADGNVTIEAPDGSDSQRWALVPASAPSIPEAERLARDWGGWDFNDWEYVERMRQRAIQYNNGETWYITNDCDFPCRDTVFALIDGQWCPVAGFYAADGSLSDQGHSRSWRAHCNIAHRNAQLAQRHWVTCYFVCNPVGDHDCQAYHDGWQPGETGYQYGGCSGLTAEHAKWIYDNVPDGAHVDICGNATVPGEPCTGDHTRLENLGINNPFA